MLGKPRGSALALTIGQISAGRAGNVIPEQGFMCGSIRAYEENVRSLAKRRLKEIQNRQQPCTGPGRGGIPSELPATVNDLQVGDEMFGYVKELVGEEGTMMLPQIMGGEDFAEGSERGARAFCSGSAGGQAGGVSLYQPQLQGHIQ